MMQLTWRNAAPFIKNEKKLLTFPPVQQIKHTKLKTALKYTCTRGRNVLKLNENLQYILFNKNPNTYKL